MNTPLPVLPHAPLGFEDDKPIPAKEIARQYTTAAVRVLVGVAMNSDDDNAKVKAAQTLLDRGWGKAEQQIDAKTEVAINITWASSDRLSYQRAAEVVEMAPAAPQPFREPQSEVGLAAVLRDADKG